MDIIDEALTKYGMVPTRVDRCTYVLHSDSCATRVGVSATGQSARPKERKVHFQESTLSVQPHDPLDLATLEKAMEHLVDPVTGSPSLNRKVIGVLCLHVDDLFMSGNDEFHRRVVEGLRHDFQVGSEDKNDILFVGQRIRWILDGKTRTSYQSGPGFVY